MIRGTETIEQLIYLLDEAINTQLCALLHAPAFQRLESAWRGLQMLVSEAGMNKHIQVRLLPLSYSQLQKDLQSAIEFDQSQLFKKIYSEEYDHPGGEPFGLLIGDYEFSHRNPQELAVLEALSKIAAASFAPFISAAAPSFFGVDKFSELQTPLNLSAIFQQAEYKRWQLLRKEEDSRFVGLTLPRILMRKPYNQRVKIRHRFFKEVIHSVDDYCWGNASYAFAAVCIRTFSQNGWFASMRGASMDGLSGGIISSLVRDYFDTDSAGLFAKFSVDIQFTDSQEKMFSDEGFLPLKDNAAREMGIFYSSQSIQKAARHTKEAAGTNAKIASMLHYLLCASRFIHHLKTMMRDKMGSFLSAEECETDLRNWLLSYSGASEQMSAERQAQIPLSEAAVRVEEHPSLPGSYSCVMQIKPHYQFDEMQTQLCLTTTLTAAEW